MKNKDKKNIDKLNKKEKKLKILLLILLILVIGVYCIIKLLLLRENRYYKRIINREELANYNFCGNIEYNDNGGNLTFINCSDCNYIDLGVLKIPDKIEDYELEEKPIDDKGDYYYKSLLYTSKKTDSSKFLISINWRPLKKIKKYYYLDSNIRTIEGLKNIDSNYDTYKYTISHYRDNLKGSIFDTIKKLKEKNDILCIGSFICNNFQNVTFYNYNDIKDIMEFNMTHGKSYMFEYKDKEYNIEIIKKDINNNKKIADPFINRIKIN